MPIQIPIAIAPFVPDSWVSIPRIIKKFFSASLVLISFLLDSYFLSICKRLRCLFVLVVIYRGPSHLAAHWCIAPLIVVSGPIVVSDGAIDLRYATIDNKIHNSYESLSESVCRPKSNE